MNTLGNTEQSLETDSDQETEPETGLFVSQKKIFSPRERGLSLILREIDRAEEFVNSRKLNEQQKLKWSRYLLGCLDQLRKWLKDHPEDVESEDLATAISKLSLETEKS